MTINEKIKTLRIERNMSQAELAFKMECSIDDIMELEINGTVIHGMELLKIISVFNISLYDLKEIEQKINT